MHGWPPGPCEAVTAARSKSDGAWRGKRTRAGRLPYPASVHVPLPLLPAPGRFWASVPRFIIHILVCMRLFVSDSLVSVPLPRKRVSCHNLLVLTSPRVFWREFTRSFLIMQVWCIKIVAITRAGWYDAR